MGLAPLRDALSTLHRALREPDILRSSDDVTVELPLEAGLRFELWLTANAPAGMAMNDLDWMKTTTGGANPYRSVVIDGVRIKWPLQSEGRVPAKSD